MPLATDRNRVKAAFEAHVDVCFQTPAMQRVADGECAFARAFHELPVSERHCRRVDFHAARNYVSVGPIGIDRGHARLTRAHSHDLGCAIGPEGDCLKCHRYLFEFPEPGRIADLRVEMPTRLYHTPWT